MRLDNPEDLLEWARRGEGYYIQGVSQLGNYYCCRAGAEAYPAPCPWHESHVATTVRLSSDESPTLGDSASPDIESNSNLTRLDMCSDSLTLFAMGFGIGFLLVFVLALVILIS